MRPRHLLSLGVLIALAALGIWIERLVVTDAEAIRILVEKTAAAAGNGDFETVAEALDPAYEAEGRDREELIAWLQTLWRRLRPLDVQVDLGEVALDGDEASAPALVTAKVLGRPVQVDVEATFHRTESGWRISGARPVAGRR